MLGIVITHHGAFDAPLIAAPFALRVAESELSGIGLLGLPWEEIILTCMASTGERRPNHGVIPSRVTR